MTAISILGALALILLLPLAVAAVRQRTLLPMAVRNIARRRSEALLVVSGAMLGTAIITSSLVVGDIMEGSFAAEAESRYGPIDVVVSPAHGTRLPDVVAAVEAAGIDDIDGLLPTVTSTMTIATDDLTRAVPRVQVVEYDLATARVFGSDADITGIADTLVVGTDGIVVNDRTAAALEITTGDAVRLHGHGKTIDLTVTEVVAEIGLAGYGGAIVAPGTIAGLGDATSVTSTPPSERLLVSLEGGVYDTGAKTDAAVTSLRTAVADLPGVEVAAPKAALLDDAERDGAAFTELFGGVGSFSVLAGILLLVNLFVMLAEERKTELGILRAVGFTRRRLTRAFAIEGAIYALVAAAIGAIAGIGVGWLVALIAGTIGVADTGTGFAMAIEPVSLGIGATTGLVISLVTVWATSLRIARLNVIRAIRDLPEPRVVRERTRTLVFAAVGVVVGVGLGVVGYMQEAAVPLLVGIPVATFSAAPLLRRILPDRTARMLVAIIVLGWSLAAFPLFRDIVGAADVTAFVVQGVVLTAGAVSLASSLDRTWAFAIERVGRGGGRWLAARLGIAYPLARRFRTSMLLGMFALVIFTVTIISAMSATFDRSTAATVEEVAAGFDLMLDMNPANPVTIETLTARDDVEFVAGLVRGTADFEAPHLDAPRAWSVTGFDADLLVAHAPALMQRDDTYATDAEAYRAVLDDPALAIVPDMFLVGDAGIAQVAVGDTITITEPGTGEQRQLTVAGLYFDWLGNGAFVSRDVTATLFGAHDVVSRAYLTVSTGIDAPEVAADLDAAFLAHGVEAHTFTAIVTDALSAQTGFMALVQGFLGLGLLVGIAGLGVVMVRAVRERRQEIGMLRAMGLRTGLVRAALLSEAGTIAVQGTLIGATLGLVTTYQLLTGSQSMGADQMPFTVPWAGLALILAVPLAASLAATAWPASRAAAVRPALALRATD